MRDEFTEIDQRVQLLLGFHFCFEVFDFIRKMQILLDGFVEC